MAGVPDRAVVTALLEAATRAPSVHNSQPWLWEYDGRQLHLMADWSRQLRYGDPDGRDLLISCGAALHHAVVAAAALGWRATVRRLPRDPDEAILATLNLDEDHPSDAAATALQAIHERRTDRRTPSGDRVPNAKVEALVRAATTHGALALVLPDDASDDLRDLMLLAAVMQHSSDDYLRELGAWTHSTADDGVPDSSMIYRPGVTTPSGAGTRFPSGRLLDLGEPERTPRQAWLLLGTSSDDTRSRLRAGEALSALMLLACLQGLAVVPYTQPIEVDATRTGLERALLRGSANLQVIVRVAVPLQGQPAIRKTRRRPVADVLRDSSSDAVAAALARDRVPGPVVT